MSLSDLFCVERQNKIFWISKEKIRFNFANESEIMALINTKNFMRHNFAKEIKKHVVITREKKVQFQLSVMKLLK